MLLILDYCIIVVCVGYVWLFVWVCEVYVHSKEDLIV